MFTLRVKGKEYSCPDESLIGLALVKALDNGKTHGNIHDIPTAKEYLESIGIEVVHDGE